MDVARRPADVTTVRRTHLGPEVLDCNDDLDCIEAIVLLACARRLGALMIVVADTLVNDDFPYYTAWRGLRPSGARHRNDQKIRGSSVFEKKPRTS